MPINYYIYAIILIIGIIIGGLIGYYIQETKVLNAELNRSSMVTYMKEQKIEAAKTLALEIKKVSDAESIARNNAIELGAARESYIQTSNNLTDINNATLTKLRDRERRESSDCSVSKSGSTSMDKSHEGITNRQSATIENSIRPDSKFIKIAEISVKNTAINDQAAIDKNALLKWIVEENCGIQKTDK